MQRAYAEKSKEKRKENAAGHMWNGQQFHIRRFSSLLFSSALFFSFILFTLYLIFFGTIICLQCPRPWRKVFILINKTRWSAESWLLDFQLISESYQFEFLLSPI